MARLTNSEQRDAYDNIVGYHVEINGHEGRAEFIGDYPYLEVLRHFERMKTILINSDGSECLGCIAEYVPSLMVIEFTIY